jgi:hypothetical protein
MKATTTVTLGTKTATVSVTGAREWNGGANVRRYFDLEMTGAGRPLSSLYEVIEGGTSDSRIRIEVNGAGRWFAYQSTHANSNTKRKALEEAVRELAQQLAA